MELGANIIAEWMYAQCDMEGKQFRLMEAIVDHKMTDDAVQKEICTSCCEEENT